MLQEYLADEFAAGADAGLGEDRLEVILDGVSGYAERPGDVFGGAALDAEQGHLASAWATIHRRERRRDPPPAVLRAG
ncbi:hypothetical protein [Nocardia sp. NPDC057440]|uniref:hypothetical protein n=1 Tax=Nocardia sp. NPDC057440 TaxID=3346134 RepID=UPI00366E5FA0